MYQPVRDVEGMPEPWRSRALDRLRQKFEVTAELRCDRILLCSNCWPHASGHRERIIADLRDLGDMAVVFGIAVGYEALA